MKQLRQAFPRAKSVIFDFDGTLAITHNVWGQVDRDVYVSRGIKRDPERYYYLINGKQISEVARIVVDEYYMSESPETIEAELRSGYARHVENARFLPGAEAFMRALRSAGVGYAIASANPADLNKLVFATKEQYELIPAVFIGCESVAHGKPEPDIFIAAAAQLGTDIRDCIVFEDSEVGLRAARASGAAVVRVFGHTNVDFKEVDAALYDMGIYDFEEVEW